MDNLEIVLALSCACMLWIIINLSIKVPKLINRVVDLETSKAERHHELIVCLANINCELMTATKFLKLLTTSSLSIQQRKHAEDLVSSKVAEGLRGEK